MRHRVKTKKFDRHAESRKALMEQLAVGFFKSNAIETTLEKAKFVKPFIERMITKSKKNDLTTRRYLIQKLQNKEIVNKLLETVGPAFLERNGGYTRIQRTTIRKGDAAQLAKLSFVVDVNPAPAKETKKAPKAKKEKIETVKAEKVEAKTKETK
jgi:large subunit ribosomal protein L17